MFTCHTFAHDTSHKLRKRIERANLEQAAASRVPGFTAPLHVCPIRFSHRSPGYCRAGSNLALRRFASTCSCVLHRAEGLTSARNIAPFSSSAWDGTGSQQDLLLRDTCIQVNEQDEIIGSASKRDAHRFMPGQPSGLLHRAFSVFLFDESNRLLLQQRASSKVTFPDVWTNTCCSHPLHGQAPSEVDLPEDIANGSVMGVKQAAVRKLEHELGIPAAQLPLDSFKFLTRLHYCAADESHAGEAEQWGEHEIDHVLFIQAAVDVRPSPDEVRDYRYVDLTELQQMMSPSSGLKWSPWFRIIADQFLAEWWQDLTAALTSSRYVDTRTIHRLDT